MGFREKGMVHIKLVGLGFALTLGLVGPWASLKIQAAESVPRTKIVPISEEKKAALLAAETRAQKALRKKLKTLGKIYYNANCDGINRIYVMNADGSGQKCLTPSPQPESTYPHVSPDGRQLLFSREVSTEVLKTLPADKRFPISGPRLKAKPMAVHRMDLASGTFMPVAAGVDAHWAPNGRKITYMMYTAKGKKFMRPAILDLESKTESVFIHLGIRAYGMPTFTRDMKHLIVSNGDTAVRVDLNETATRIADNGNVSGIISGHPCNMELSADGKWLVWVLDTHADTGGWLHYGAFKPGGHRMRGKRLSLGWASGSVNYFPDFSPDGSYLVYAHADRQEGVKSWLLNKDQELYVTTFPDCKTTVRITFNGAGNQHPHWVGAR